MQKLLSSEHQSLFLGPRGFEWFVSASHPALATSPQHRCPRSEPGLSLLGPFWITAENAQGRPLLPTSAAALFTRTEGPNGSIELRFPAADGSGLLWVICAQLCEHGLLLWQTLRNQTRQPVTPHAFRLEAAETKGSFLDGVGAKPGWHVFRTGYSSFSPSFAVDSRFQTHKPLFPTAAAFNLLTESPYYGQPDCLSSPWMMVFSPPEKAGAHLLCGFVGAHRGLGEIALCRDKTPRVEFRQGFDGRTVEVGESLVGDKLLLCFGTSERAVLEQYVDSVAQEMRPRPLPIDIPSGWCSWYYYYTHVTEKDVLRNLSAIQEKKLPIKYVQLDDGYQRKVGDWLAPNAKFPSGLGSLARQIREAGFVPGIWLAPFFVQRSSLIFKQQPQWLLRDETGALRRLGYHPFWGLTDGQVYSLDLTHKEVLAWLRRVFSTLCELGFDYFKIDFLFAGLRRGKRNDPSLSPVEAYRQGLRVIRETIGDRFLLGCGAPLLPSVGFVDAMRISPDVKESWRDEHVDLIARGTGYPSAELALHNCLTRAHLHGKWWVNDPDCVLVRRERSSLSLPEVQTLSVLMSLSGGMLVASDDLHKLQNERLHLLQTALPPTGKSAWAQGLLRSEKPSVFVHLEQDRAGVLTALGSITNWCDGPREIEVSPTIFGLPDGNYIAFEFFSKTHKRLQPGGAVTLRAAPHGTALWLVRANRGHPQIATVTHHFWQTLFLLRAESWNPETLTLTVQFVALGCREGELWFAVPDGLRFAKILAVCGPVEVRSDFPTPGGVALGTVFLQTGGEVQITVQFQRV